MGIKVTARDVFWADMTVSEAGAISYGTPTKLCGAVQVAIAQNKTPQKIFESGACIHNKTYISGGTVTVQTNTLGEADKAKLAYGLTVTSSVDYQVGADTDSPKRGAIGVSVLEADGKIRCNWFYDCTMTPPDETYSTSDESGPKSEPESYEFAYVRRPSDRKYRRTAVVADETAAAAFFAAVEPAA